MSAAVPKASIRPSHLRNQVSVGMRIGLGVRYSLDLDLEVDLSQSEVSGIDRSCIGTRDGRPDPRGRCDFG